MYRDGEEIMVKQKLMGLNGDEAVAYATKQVNPDVVAAYPITPQTIIVERYSEYVADGEVDTNFVAVGVRAQCYELQCWRISRWSQSIHCNSVSRASINVGSIIHRIRCETTHSYGCRK
jgi:hypothetical protein